MRCPMAASSSASDAHRSRAGQSASAPLTTKGSRARMRSCNFSRLGACQRASARPPAGQAGRIHRGAEPKAAEAGSFDALFWRCSLASPSSQRTKSRAASRKPPAAAKTKVLSARVIAEAASPLASAERPSNNSASMKSSLSQLRCQPLPAKSLSQAAHLTTSAACAQSAQRRSPAAEAAASRRPANSAQSSAGRSAGAALNSLAARGQVSDRRFPTARSNAGCGRAGLSGSALVHAVGVTAVGGEV
mmetsp:Transcript_63656/g.127684  ORF Transcript_63656/g.127684 Transcript_63656/m.127684 type:complete len:247 (+) Transcript_63656:684-1424(+)